MSNRLSMVFVLLAVACASARDTRTMIPARGSFELVRPRRVTLPPPALVGRWVFGKIALDEALQKSVYLGRVDKGLDLSLSIPRTVTRVFYQAWDETGQSVHGSLAVAE